MLNRALIGGGFALVAAAAAASPAASSERLSDERSVTVWANPAAVAPVLARPRHGAKRRGRLHMKTEDGFPEVYLVLNRRLDSRGRAWIRVRLPGRPNGGTGWVRRPRLGLLNTVTTRLVIDRGRLRALFFRGGRKVWSAPVGVGAPGTPTPGGRFWIREGFRVRGRGLYGPYAFGTSAYSDLSEWPGGGVVGIHGTNEPWLVPGRPSHGCIRMRNRDVLWLAARMPVGTPLRIR